VDRHCTRPAIIASLVSAAFQRLTKEALCANMGLRRRRRPLLIPQVVLNEIGKWPFIPLTCSFTFGKEAIAELQIFGDSSECRISKWKTKAAKQSCRTTIFYFRCECPRADRLRLTATCRMRAHSPNSCLLLPLRPKWENHVVVDAVRSYARRRCFSKVENPSCEASSV
jgi:hypothetical protein